MTPRAERRRSSPNGSRRPGIATVAGLVLFVLLAAVAPTVDSDAFWHLRLGRWIVENGGSLPRIEGFSHTAAGAPIVIQGWLADVLHYLIERQFGARGVGCATAAVFVATWWAVYAAARTAEVRSAQALLITGAGMVAATGLMAPRPLLVSNLAFACVLLALLKHQTTGRRIWLAALPPVFALWGNLHFAYPAGLGLIGAFALASLLERTLPRSGRRPPSHALGVGGTLVLGALCLLALCANPYGPGVLIETLRMAGLNAQSGLIEWARPDFSELRGALFLLPLALLAIAWLPGPRRPDWLDLLLTLPLVAAALSAQRHVPMACIAITVAVARAHGRSAPRLRDANAADTDRPSWRFTTTVLVASAVGAAWWLPQAAERDRRTVASAYPDAAVRFIRAQGLQGPLLNSYAMGGFLVDRLADQVPVFIDGRYIPFAGVIKQDHDAITGLRPGWEKLLERYRIRLALLGPEDAEVAAAMVGSGRFRKVFAEGGFVVLQSVSARALPGRAADPATTPAAERHAPTD